MQDRNGRPVIVMSARLLATDPAYGHFLMAHECCHHTLGHVRRFAGLGQLGPQPFYYIRPALRNMELDADTCAVKMLKATHEPDAIEAGRLRMLSFGTAPTGAYYPDRDRTGRQHRQARRRSGLTLHGPRDPKRYFLTASEVLAGSLSPFLKAVFT